jgi:DNA-binding NtrC family response regulator
MSPEALQKLLQHSWPGNVRELEGVITRAVLLASSNIIGASDMDVPDSITNCHPTINQLTFKEAKNSTVRNFEYEYLLNLLSAHQGNVSRASKAAGKERRTFQRLLSKHSIDPRTFRP